MIEVRHIEGTTYELVTDDAEAENAYVEEALDGSDWADTWDWADEDGEGRWHMKFDQADKRAILSLLESHSQLEHLVMNLPAEVPSADSKEGSEG